MGKNKIIDLFSANTENNSEQKNLIAAIEEACLELQNAQNYFDIVNEPALIDYAIFMEKAARARYSYLIAEARRNGITVKYSYVDNEAEII